MKIKPTDLAELLAMREVGNTVAVIAQRFNISPRTVQRYLSEHEVKRGTLTHEAIEVARNRLLNFVTSDEVIKTSIASLITDNIAHSLHLREKAMAASEFLIPTDNESAAITMRGLSAYSVILKNTSDVIRSTLMSDKSLLRDDIEDLPELVVREIYDEEVEKLILDTVVEED